MSRPFLRVDGNDVDVMGVVEIRAIRLLFPRRPFPRIASTSRFPLCVVTSSWNRRTSRR